MTQRRLDPAPGPTGRDPSPWLRRAWVSVALIPVFFFFAFAAAEGIYALSGYQPENADAPLWVDVLASVLALAVFVIPSAAAVHFGRRAIKGGDRRGFYPAVIGALVTLAWVVLTLVNQ